MLDRTNYYATTGGHGACRGCGEVTAIRLVTATNHAIHDKRRRTTSASSRSLIERTGGQARPGSARTRPSARRRIGSLLETLEKRLYLYESGPTGNGPAPTVIANATGCSSVYASTFPFNPYNDPWVNSLFQDSSPLAKGIFEGLAAQLAADIRALRIARLELDDAYDPPVHDRALRTLSWEQFTPEERDLLPTVITIGGDGATYDIGFGALSRLLASDTPIKVAGAQHRRLFQHRRAGLDRELHRPGLRPVALRRRPRRQAGVAQGTRPDRLVPPERVRVRHQHRAAGALPGTCHGVPELPGARGARRLHAVRPSTASPTRSRTPAPAWRSRAA